MDLNELLDDYETCDTQICNSVSDMDCLDSNSNINILHINITSIYKNMDNFLVWLEASGKTFDVMVMSETHPIYNDDDFRIPGYEVVYSNSFLNRCDGCIIFIKNEIFLDSKIINIRGQNFLKILINKNNFMAEILGTYRSPSLGKNDFIDNLNELLITHIEKNIGMTIFIGDININLLKKNNTLDNYLNLLAMYGFACKIKGVTRDRGLQKSCPDHCFVKYNDRRVNKINAAITHSKITDTHDHYPIILSVQLKSHHIPSPQKIQTKTKINYDTLDRLLFLEDWAEVINKNDVEQCANSFIDILQKYIQNTTATKNIPNKEQRLKPWISAGLLVSIRKRDKLKKTLACNPDSVSARLNYEQYRKKLTKLIKNSKTYYYKQQLSNHVGDARKTWNTIKSITNQNIINTNVKSISTERKELNNPYEIANEFNEFFSKVGKKLASKINCNIHLEVENIKNPHSCYFAPITENELVMQINKLKNNACSSDIISTSILKKYHKYLVKPLLFLINLIFNRGAFPSILKKAVIVPIYKSGNKKLTTNYRPIALTTSITKLVEKCIKLRLNSFIEKYKIISTNQFGFRENLGTEKALCKLTEYVNKCFNEGKKALGVFLDLSKAFDTVSHRILLERLENIGIRGVSLQLFKTYLSNRSQQVRLGDIYSRPLAAEFGVPQGTVLGPILFSIYINKITNILEDASVLCFADDTVVLVKGESWEEAYSRAEQCISKVKQWLDSSLLTLNKDKSHFIAFSMAAATQPAKDHIKLHKNTCNLLGDCTCEIKIYKTDMVKYLGVYIDKYLRWDKHVEYVTTKLRKLIYKFLQLRQILNRKTLKMVYHSLVESILTYGLVVWGLATENVLRSLKVMQKCILKIMIFKDIRYPSSELFGETQVFPFELLVTKIMMSFMFKNESYKTVLMHKNNTRNLNNKKLQIPKMKFSATQKHISYVGPKLFNSIPDVFKLKPYARVKNELNKWILENNICVNL